MPRILSLFALVALCSSAAHASGPDAGLGAKISAARTRLQARRQEILSSSHAEVRAVGVDATAGVGVGLWAGIGQKTVRGVTTYGLYLSPRARLGLGLGAKVGAEETRYVPAQYGRAEVPGLVPVGEQRIGGSLVLGVGLSGGLSDSLGPSLAKKQLGPFAPLSASRRATLEARASEMVVGDTRGVAVGAELSVFMPQLIGNFGVPLIRTKAPELRWLEKAERHLASAERQLGKGALADSAQSLAAAAHAESKAAAPTLEE